MKRKSFTIMEVLIVLIIVAILAAIAIPVYNYASEKQKIEICSSHLEAILESIKIYDMEYDEIPLSLAKVWRKYGDKALVIVLERKKKEGRYTYLAYITFQKFKYFLANIFAPSSANAQPSFFNFVPDKSILKCPADPNRLYNFLSYTINLNAVRDSSTRRSRRWHDIQATDIIVGDCDESGNLAFNRHRQSGINGAIIIDKKGTPALRDSAGNEHRIGDHPQPPTGREPPHGSANVWQGASPDRSGLEH